MASGRSLTEIREIFKFLSTLWGLLAAVSLVFPYSNVLLQAIPTNDFDELRTSGMTSATLTTLATVASIFALFVAVTLRAHLIGGTVRIVTIAIITFVVGFACIVNYVSQYGWMLQAVERSHSDNTMQEFFFSLAALYPAFFGCVTFSFALIGVHEYAR